MALTHNDSERQAVIWLKRFSQTLDADPEIIDMMPIEDVRAELQAKGLDVEGFHATLRKRLRKAKLDRVKDALIQWISPVWQPQWAGQFVGAGDRPEQTQTFRLEQGEIELTCSWKPQAEDTPPYLELSWKADMTMDGELWCRFIHAESKVILAELPLGTYKEGGKYFTPQKLGFDPSTDPWELAIVVKDNAL